MRFEVAVVLVSRFRRATRDTFKSGIVLLAAIGFLTACIPSSDNPGVPSEVANLASLDLTDSTQKTVGLSPAFDGNVTSYVADVGGTISSVSVKAVVPNPGNTTVRLQRPDGQITVLTSGQASDPIQVAPGSNILTLTVEAPGLTKAYTVTVNRGTNPNLQSLVLSAGGLSPAFAPATTEYAVTTGFGTQTTTVTATLADSASTFTVNGAPGTSGVPSNNIQLNVGPTIITVVVRAQDATTKTYTVVITRAGTSDLANLQVSGATVSPAFDPGRLSGYSASVPFGTSLANIIATAADTTASIVIVNKSSNASQSATSGQPSQVPLNVGPNLFEIVVTGAGVTPKTYALSISQAPPSGNANLSNLTVSPGALSPAFSSGNTDYTVDVASSVSSITVTATKADPNASVTINGVSSSSRSISLNPAGTPTVISVVVLAQDGATTKNYLITVNRTQSGNNNLESLTVSPGDLSPTFNASTTSYSVVVASTVGSVTVTAQPQDGSASVSINGQTTTSRSVTLGAAGSSTPISIVVTAPNGSQKTYSVVVNRAALGGNNNLQSLSVSPGSLSPSFNANELNYTVNVASTVGSVTVTAQPQDGSASVSINGQTTTSRSVTLGAAGSSTPISIVVTAPNGSQKTYSVVVNRAALGGNNNLQSLSVSPGPLSPSFNANELNYTVNVAGTVGSVTVTAQPQDGSASVSINGQTTTSRSVTLGPDGTSTPISIVVTAPNGSQKTYTVIVNRAALSGNNNLQSLSVSPGSLSPSFNANELNYTVNVASTVGSVTVTAQPQDGSASVSINGQTTTSRSVTLGAAGSSTPISIVVTAPNGSQKTYSVVVNRAAIILSGNNNLSNLVASAGPLSPAFDPAVLSYSATVAKTVTSTTVTATLADLTATLTINGAPATSGQASNPINLAVGENSVPVVVTAENGMPKTYTVTITVTP